MTAVEFYRTELNALVSFRKTDYKTENEIFEKAKEIENNQRLEDFKEGFHSAFGSLELANKVVQSKKLKSA